MNSIKALNQSKLGSGQDIKDIYRKIRPQIKSRLAEFKRLFKEGTEEVLFAELVFCILTPQSKARTCWECVEGLKRKNLLFSGSAGEIAKNINKARFKNNKARYIIEARKQFLKNGKFNIGTQMSQFENARKVREWLVGNIKGFGYKEASHFLRNIGLGKEIAILDRHILKNLGELEVIKGVPYSLSKKKYLEIEHKMKEFSKNVNIPLEHLDLVFWYKETGEIFK